MNQAAFLPVIILGFAFNHLQAQTVVDTSKYGKVTYVQENSITSLMNKQILCSEKNKTISGYRVQIHFGSEREKAKEIRTKFLKAHPDIPAYELYQQPNFKIRVGDFRTKLEAQKFQKEIVSEFTSSFVVSDEIQLPRLENE